MRGGMPVLAYLILAYFAPPVLWAQTVVDPAELPDPPALRPTPVEPAAEDSLAKSKRYARHYRYLADQLLLPIVGACRVSCQPIFDGDGALESLRLVVVCGADACQALGEGDGDDGTETLRDILRAAFPVNDEHLRVVAVPEKSLAKLAAAPALPAWVESPPCEPGKAFYAVGQSDESLEAAQLNAYVALARTFKVRVRSSGDGPGQATCTVVDFTLCGGVIVRHEIVNTPEGRVFYALARVGMDDVAESLHREASDAVKKVQRNAKEAFDELDRLLQGETEADWQNPARKAWVEAVPKHPGEAIHGYGLAAMRHDNDESKTKAEALDAARQDAAQQAKLVVHEAVFSQFGALAREVFGAMPEDPCEEFLQSDLVKAEWAPAIAAGPAKQAALAAVRLPLAAFAAAAADRVQSSLAKIKPDAKFDRAAFIAALAKAHEDLLIRGLQDKPKPPPADLPPLK